MVFLLNSKPVDALALIVITENAIFLNGINCWSSIDRFTGLPNNKWDEHGSRNSVSFQTLIHIVSTSTWWFFHLSIDKVIPRQLFEVPIQAAVGKRLIARETLSAYRADVTAGLYGGHYERKLKHLENQKESKKRMKKIGTVELPQEAFYDILKT